MTLFNPVQLAITTVLAYQIKGERHREATDPPHISGLKPRPCLPSRYFPPTCFLPENRALETEGQG